MPRCQEWRLAGLRTGEDSQPVQGFRLAADQFAPAVCQQATIPSKNAVDGLYEVLSPKLLEHQRMQDLLVRCACVVKVSSNTVHVVFLLTVNHVRQQKGRAGEG